MTVNLALEYIPRRMRELGIEKYSIRFRHMVLQPSEKLSIDGFNQIYLLVEEAEDVQVSSELGVFDLSLAAANEMQYEHQGEILVSNQAFTVKHVRFIQIIPER